MQIAAYLKTSLIEWPGKIVSVIFTPGCNFRCPFCHNAHLVDPQQVNHLTLLKEEEVLKDLVQRKEWIEAVAITGGEPTLQKDLLAFLSKIKAMGYRVMLEQNGTHPEIIKKLINQKLVDYFCLDLKGNFENYSKFSGVKTETEKIRESLWLIAESGLECELRTTVVPGLHTKENLIKLAEEIKEILAHSRLKIENCRWYLQQFRPIGCLNQDYLGLKPFSPEELKSWLLKLQKIIPQTTLRGI